MTISKESIEAYLDTVSKLAFAYLLNPLTIVNMKIPMKADFISATKKFTEAFRSEFPTECDVIDKIVFPDYETKKKLDFSEYALLKQILETILQKFDSVVQTPQIFISHSSLDEPVVKLFVDLLSHIGISSKNLFCSSIPGYGIKQGDGNIYDFLKTKFLTRKLFVIFMLSENYYKSPACLNEMGAAWVLQTKRQSILLPGFGFSQINGAIDPRDICFKLDDVSNRSHALTELKDNLITFLDLEPISSTEWEYHRDNFWDRLDHMI